jgi:hypothetical protein
MVASAACCLPTHCTLCARPAARAEIAENWRHGARFENVGEAVIKKSWMPVLLPMKRAGAPQPPPPKRHQNEDDGKQ